MTNDIPTTPVAILDEFLVAAELRRLVDFTLARASTFHGTQVIGAEGAGYRDHDVRRSRVLYDIGHHHQIFADRLTTFAPYVFSQLASERFPISQIEIQLTASNNGEFFRMHADNGSHDVRSRDVTFVYFFHREPRAFSGGELRIYDTDWSSGGPQASGPSRIVFPLQNQVVFFPSNCLHEILPVGCPSQDFGDSRFTVNGWFHR